MSPINRRQFLIHSAMAGAGSMFAFRNASAFAQSSSFSDYKALVCIFLDGGNDCWNTFVPINSEGNSSYGTYKNQRGELAVKNQALTLPAGESFATGAGNPYYEQSSSSLAYLKGHYPMPDAQAFGVNAVMPELAKLIADKKASVVSNIGALVEPIGGKDEYDAILSGSLSKKIPLFLFAHNHQTRVFETGQADSLHASGWAGRIADLWSDLYADRAMGLNVSLSGQRRLMAGQTTSPVILKPGSVITLSGVADLSKEAHTNRRNLLESLWQSSSTETPFASLYNKMLQKSLGLSDLLTSNWEKKTDFTAVTGSYGEPLFEIPTKEQMGFDEDIDGKLIEQLESVAHLISLGHKSDLMNYQRQIFFVRLGSFDHHGDQYSEHPTKLRELSLALGKFQKALNHMGVADKVVSFTASEFGRTMSNNGDGTDHGWSGCNLVMTEAPNFKGGKIVGNLPDLNMEGADDSGSKGRFIPSISHEQMLGSLCKWFGVEDEQMLQIFPNLAKFQTDNTISSAYLEGLIP